MTVTTTRIEPTGPAIHAALTASSPEEAAQFERDYRAALSHAAETLDTADAEALLARWWGIATIRANPLTPEEEELVSRIRAGDETALASLSSGPVRRH